MDQDGTAASEQPGPGAIRASAEFQGSEKIADARRLARSFLDEAQSLHGLQISARAADAVMLVVSELVTNARTYAPGAYRLALEVRDGCVEVSVWDGDPAPPALRPPDPLRIGQHGLEIVMAASRSFHVHRAAGGKRVTASISLSDRDQRGPSHTD
ncbi:ATP-binding protein [Streptomyces sp. NPDC089795]|uniref:ATP-binding protein n=1 Tax=Streptomyces sp. NPDC089795 TaxID=3155297 RepID=UPI003442B375